MELGAVEPSLRWNGALKEGFKAKNDGKEETQLAIEPRCNLKANSTDAMRVKGAVHCNVKLGYATMVTIKITVESYRERKTMQWDPKTEAVVAE